MAIVYKIKDVHKGEDLIFGDDAYHRRTLGYIGRYIGIDEDDSSCMKINWMSEAHGGNNHLKRKNEFWCYPSDRPHFYVHITECEDGSKIYKATPDTALIHVERADQDFCVHKSTVGAKEAVMQVIENVCRYYNAHPPLHEQLALIRIMTVKDSNRKFITTETNLQDNRHPAIVRPERQVAF